MRRIATYFSILVTLLSAVSCELKSSELDKLKLQMEEIKTRIALINNDITSLQALIKAVSERDCIVDTVPFFEDGREAGYIIKLRHGEDIVIRNGKDGKDGINGSNGKDGEDADAPVIGVGQEKENGVWYWTLNGKWIYDDYNNRLMVYGTEAVVPEVKISDGYWYISYDSRRTWTRLMEVSGSPDSIFSGISNNTHTYYFYMNNGESIPVPRYKPFDVNITSSEQSVKAGSTVTVDFSISGFDWYSSLKVAFHCSNDLSASYRASYRSQPNSTYDITGAITITIPKTFVSGTVTAFFYNGTDLITKTINCNVK